MTELDRWAGLMRSIGYLISWEAADTLCVHLYGTGLYELTNRQLSDLLQRLRHQQDWIYEFDEGYELGPGIQA